MARRLCDVDGKAFYGEKSLYDHNKCILEKNMNVLCARRHFLPKTTLETKQKYAHFEGQNTCKTCQAVFTTAWDLRRHEN